MIGDSTMNIEGHKDIEVPIPTTGTVVVTITLED